jgi:phage terminase large subunit GpA-like protein
MDAFNDPAVKRVVGMFSAQVGKTTILENVIGYHVHHDPSPIMVVQPTLEIAEAFSKDRLSPMVRDTPALKQRFSEAGSKTSGDTLLHKKFPGGHVTLAGANSFNSLASRPIRIVLGDEAAKWKPNEKGSPFRQVSVRVRAFFNAKQGYFSTPTDTKNEFHKMWEESDKRLFEVPCPHCGLDIVYAFDETPGSLPTSAEVNRGVLRWVEGQPIRTDEGRTIRRADDAWFECLSCGSRIDDVDRHRSVQQGRWTATQTFYGTAGFWGWQGISPFSRAIDIANEWLGALGSPIELQSAKNETLGLPWTEQGDAPDWKRLYDRAVASPRSLGEVPADVLLLTAGVDVQKDWIELYVWGWGRGKQCWLIDHVRIDGDVKRADVWNKLDAALGTVYQHESGADMVIRKACVDTGHEADAVYDWARRHRSNSTVALIKGGPASMTAIMGAPSPVETTSGGKKLATGIKVTLLNVSLFKGELYGRLRLDAPNLERGESYPDGYVHLCPTTDTEEFCRQLTAEQLVSSKNRNGYDNPHWEKTRPRNEALDDWAYARAGAMMLGLDRLKEHDWQMLEGQLDVPKPVPAVAAPVITQQTQGGSGWISGGRSRGSGGWFSR